MADLEEDAELPLSTSSFGNIVIILATLSRMCAGMRGRRVLPSPVLRLKLADIVLI